MTSETDKLRQLQEWLYQQRISLSPLDKNFHIQYAVYKQVGIKLRELLNDDNS